MDRRFEGRFQVNGISGIHQVPGKPPAGAVEPGGTMACQGNGGSRAMGNS